jgi:hypothetical protein
VVVDGVRSRRHLPLRLGAEPCRAQVLLRALHAGRSSRRIEKPRARKETIRKKSRLSLIDPSPQHGGGRLCSFTLFTSAFSRKPCAVSMGSAVSSRRNAAAVPRAKTSGFGCAWKNQETRFAMCAGARFTYLPGRTRRRATASRPRSQRRRARRRRPREPSGQTRRPRVRSRQHAQGDGRDGGTRRARACLLQNPLPSALCRRELVSPVWWGLKRNRVASRRQVLCWFAPLSVVRSRAAGTRGEHRVR